MALGFSLLEAGTNSALGPNLKTGFLLRVEVFVISSVSGASGIAVTRYRLVQGLGCISESAVFQFCRLQSAFPNLLFMPVSQIFVSHTHPWPRNIVLEMAGQENGGKTKRWRERQVVKEAPV